MYPRSVRALQADVLFVSALERSDELNASQILRAGRGLAGEPHDRDQVTAGLTSIPGR